MQCSMCLSKGAGALTASNPIASGLVDGGVADSVGIAQISCSQWRVATSCNLSLGTRFIPDPHVTYFSLKKGICRVVTASNVVVSAGHVIDSMSCAKQVTACLFNAIEVNLCGAVVHAPA